MYDEGGAFCATIHVHNRLTSPMVRLSAQMDEISAGYEGYRYLTNAPSSCCGTGANLDLYPDSVNKPTDLTGGLWLFGDVPADGTATVQWTFRNPGGPFTFNGRLVAQFSETPNGEDDDRDGVDDNGLGLFDNGDVCAANADCSSNYCLATLCTASAPPTVTTSAATSVTAATAQLNGDVTSVGTPAASAHGFCYSTTDTTPTHDEATVTCTSLGTPAGGAFSEVLSGLSGETTYHARVRHERREHGVRRVAAVHDPRDRCARGGHELAVHVEQRVPVESVLDRRG